MMQKMMKKFLALSLSAAMLGSVLPQNVSAAEEEYLLYPAPHEITYGTGSYELKDLNVIYGEGIDEATENRLEETAALRELQVSVAETADSAKTNVYVAIYDSEDDQATEYILEKYAVDAELFEKTDSNYVASNDGEIVVLGKDTDSCFYGLTTLYQIFGQLEEDTLRNFVIEDYADVQSRGFIEGYYGNPWSTEDRINLMTWGGYYKLNSYFYAPKDDPKHNSKWKELYTEEEIETLIKPLADAGNASKCRFVYALHPYMYDAIRSYTQNPSGYQEDLKSLQAKFSQVIEAGVRQIAILADDAANVGSENYIKMLEDMTAWIKEMQKTYPDLKLSLPFVAVEYMTTGQSYYRNFPENVQIVMTGGKVWGEVSNSFTSTFTSTAGRGPYLWINWPCTDNSKKHLIMGGYKTFLQTGVDPENIQGIVLNPMQQSEPSKVAIFGNACYSWNIWETEAEADEAYDTSFACVDHNTVVPNAASEALKELSKHMINQDMDSRVTKLQESVDLKDELSAFEAKLLTNTFTKEDVQSLIEEFTILADAAKTYRAEAGDTNVRDQIVYWLDCWDDTTDAILNYLNALNAILDEEAKDVIDTYRVEGQKAFENSLTHALWYVDHYEYAEVGVQHIVPFMEALDDYLWEKEEKNPQYDISLDGVKVTAGSVDNGIYGNNFGKAEYVIDNDPNTVWMTDWYGYGSTIANGEGWIDLEFPEAHTVDGVRYLPGPEAGGVFTSITAFEIYVKTADSQEYAKAAEGTWENKAGWKMIKFDPVENVTNVKILATQALPHNWWAIASEIRVISVTEKESAAVDKTDLANAIAYAETLNAEDYVDFSEVEKALEAAKAIYADENAAAEEVNEAGNNLMTAIEALEEKAENEVVRLSGTDRYQTGIAVAEELKAVLGVEKFETAIIATGSNFADALSGSYLAAVKDAPILLTNGKAANVAALHEYIKANVTAGGTIYVLGGEGAVSAAAADIDGYNVERLSGADRYETNLAILLEAGFEGDNLIVATGKSFADSLSASAAGKPILLAKKDAALNDAQKAVAANFKNIYVVGGAGAVAESTAAELAAYGSVTRLSGASRYETSVAIANAFFADADQVVLASGKNFPDGLCGGALAAALNAPLVLTRDGSEAAAADYVAANGIASGYVLGGEGALSNETVITVFGMDSADEIIGR